VLYRTRFCYTFPSPIARIDRVTKAEAETETEVKLKITKYIEYNKSYIQYFAIFITFDSLILFEHIQTVLSTHNTVHAFRIMVYRYIYYYCATNIQLTKKKKEVFS